MKIVDIHGNELNESAIDLNSGYLIDDWMLKKGVDEVDFVLKHRYEDDDFEQVKRFVPVSTDEIRDRRIEELKRNLSDTDYLVIKVVEGAATLSEISEYIKKRAEWRKEINELESKSIVGEIV